MEFIYNEVSTINYFLETADAGHDFIDMLLSDELAHDGTKRESGRYRWGEGARPYQHEPKKRELYLTMKNYGSIVGKNNGFSKYTSAKTAKIMVEGWDVNVDSIGLGSGNDFSNSNKSFYSNGYSNGVHRYEKEKYSSPFTKDQSEVNNDFSNSNKSFYSNGYSNGVHRYEKEKYSSPFTKDQSEVNNDFSNSNKSFYSNGYSNGVHRYEKEKYSSPFTKDQSEVNNDFSNSYKKIYSNGARFYEKEKYSTPVFSTNPSNEELNAIKNRRKLEREVHDSFKESNQNGSKTTEVEASSYSQKDIWARTEKGGKDKPNISLAERTARDVKSTTDDLINGATKILNNMKSNRKMKNNAKGLSNDEIRERIARIRLEKEYNQLTANDVNTGYDKTMRVLSTLGTAVSVGAGVVSIVAGVKNMKSGGKNG